MRQGALVLALLVLSAGAPARAVTVPPVTIAVTIDQVAFKESSVSAHVGDTIEWTNRDVVDHTATAKNHDFDVEIHAGKKAHVVLKHAGDVEYYCQYHPNMTARVVVTAR
jgi:plastocyanin